MSGSGVAGFVNGRPSYALQNAGGAGLVSNGAAVTNRGRMEGGQGLVGGDGVSMSGGSLDSSGSILGGSGTSLNGGVGVYLDGGTLTTSGLISGGVSAGSSLTSAAVQFGSQAATLVADSGASFNGAIAGFATGDTIDLANVSVSQAITGFNHNTYTLAGGTDGTLQFTGDFSGETFQFNPDGSGGTDVTIACYRRGTRILSERGEVPIEALRIGDRVATLSGAMLPVRWIGRRSYTGGQAAGNADVLPVRIGAGALGQGLPRRDLWVSPEHAMYVDGMLIATRDLVNGASIVQERAVREVTYLHLEFDAHVVIYAERAAAESFLDDESRRMFDNAAEHALLYPQALRKPARFCAPRVDQSWELEAVRERLAARVLPVEVTTA